MLSAYPAIFLKEGAGYSVIFPDFNYLATCGDTLDEALDMAVECLAGRLYLMQQDNEPFPTASRVEDIDVVSVCKELEVTPTEYFVNPVTVDAGEYAKAHFDESVKKIITIPAWLNAAATESNVNFSQVLQEALKKRLNLA